MRLSVLSYSATLDGVPLRQGPAREHANSIHLATLVDALSTPVARFDDPGAGNPGDPALAFQRLTRCPNATMELAGKRSLAEATPRREDWRRIVANSGIGALGHGERIALASLASVAHRPDDSRDTTDAHRLVALAVVGDDGAYLAPCGRCRQILFEFGGPELQIDTGDAVRTLDDLLPGAFGPADLPPTARRTS